MNQKYNSILEKFFHTEKIIDYSLDKIRDACLYFDNPQDSFQSIHIAGTNGKGSTAKMIFQMLKDDGRNVGVYTSPHNIDIRERFETENGFISEEDFVRIAEKIIVYGRGLSYYEKCVLLAFLYFREKECEYAVIEVGMGGRLDATNIITPILSIITSIGYDHMEFLGNTLEEISFEKGGIIKESVPTILYGKNETLEKIGQSRGSKIIFPKSRQIHTNMIGLHQESNARIAYEAGMFLGIGEDTIQSGLVHVEHSGRLQYLLPNLLIDGAHNEGGIKQLKLYLESLNRDKNDIIYCVNLKKGKSVNLFTDILPDIKNWILIQSEHQMIETPEILSVALYRKQQYSEILSPIQIITFARNSPKKLFVVFGSLYMIGEFLVSLQ